MAWIISNALMRDYENSHCSQAQEVESLEGIYSDGKPSAQSSGTPMPLLYCAPDKTREFSRFSRSGMMCSNLMESLGADLLTWYLGDFLAKTSAAQAEVKELKENDQACGSTWRESLAKYDHDTHSWKTAQCSLLADSESFSETWPRSGTMLHGVAYLGNPLEQVIREIGYGSLLPTPCASDHRNRGDVSNPSIQRRIKIGKQVGLSMLFKGETCPICVENMMGWPLGWTDCTQSATDKYQSWLQTHSFS